MHLDAARILRSAAAVGVLFALATGCGDDGPSHDFAVTGIEIVGDGSAPSPARPGGPALPAMASPAIAPGMPEVQIGHPVLIQLTLESAATAKNLTADVFLLDKATYGEPDPDAPQPDPDAVDPNEPEGNDGERIRIGQATIEEVKKGTHDYVVSVLVPYFEPTTEFDEEDPPDEEPAATGDPLAVGEYYLYAELDPEERFDETSEENNSPATTGFESGAKVVDLRGDYKEVPNVYLEKVVVDLPLIDLGELSSILLPHPDDEAKPEPDFCGDYDDPADPFDEALENVANTYAGVTAWVNASGAYWKEGEPTPIPLVEMGGTLIVRDKRYPVQLWDGEAGDYYDSIEIEDLTPGVARKVHADLRLDPSQARALIADLETVVNGCFAPYPCPVRVCFPGTSICRDVESPLCYAEHHVAILECLDREYLALVETTRLEADIVAWDESGSSVLVEWDDPPGFAYTNTWPPVPEDPEAWPPLEINLVPPRGIGEAGEVFPPGDREALESSYETGFGGEYVSAGVTFWSGVGIDGDGAFAGVDGRIPVSVFGKTFDLYKVDLDARGLNESILDNWVNFDVFIPTSLKSRIALKGRYPFPCIDVLDREFSKYQLGGEECIEQSCFTDELGNEDKCGICRTKEDLKSKNPVMVKACKECNACRKECFSYGVAQFVTRDFVAGIIPMTATMGAQALVGLNVTAEFPICTSPQAPSSLSLYAGPFVDASAGLEAGFGNSKGVAIGAGADITLINDTFYARASVVDLDHTASRVSGTLRADVTNTLTGPNGEIYWWTGYPCLRVCRKWGVPYPCGLKQCRDRHPIDSFESKQYVDRLLCEEEPNAEVTRF